MTQSRRGTGSSSARARRRAFVVDDNVETLTLLDDVVRNAGWETRCFTRLRSVRRALRESPPMLMILDDELPDGRGGDLVQELRSDPRLRDVSVIVCTAADPARQAEIGAWAPVLSKPFSLADLERYLQRAA